ncbi:hypothetical protein CGCA056_v003832 [Colletotrichum aenigma]|uniref:uncharacterized protein n=1 Tax=Colletotrichum aenigma TaxID=1215731 RepID=UPI001872E2DB|nr:uncharacterized protein CGCA056_v003832 [Colletotrichum aenigma]KAF5526054.1 hypothetical protein CGCA056_v003832 [Colletotrichum aenigma]
MNPVRAKLKHNVIVKDVSTDDEDGPRYMPYSKGRKFYSHDTQNDISGPYNTTRIGIQNLAERPVASRGVLLDWADYAAEKIISYNAFDSFEIPYTDLQIIADSHDIKFQEGDILLIRSGYQLQYEALSETESDQNFASPYSPHGQNAGPVVKLSLYHLMEIDDPTDLTIFPIKSSTVGAGTFVEDDNFGKQFFKIDNVLNISPEEIKTKSVPTGPAIMRDVASVVRPKTSGPFELTFDNMCDDENHYQRVKRANLLINETIKKLY